MSFKSVQKKLERKDGVSKKAAGALLASASRNASAKAKRANPKLRRVKINVQSNSMMREYLFNGLKKCPEQTGKAGTSGARDCLTNKGVFKRVWENASFYISSDLVDIDSDGMPGELSCEGGWNLRWEEVKTDMGVEQNPFGASRQSTAIDALSYVIATINRPKKAANMTPKTDLVKPFYPQLVA